MTQDEMINLRREHAKATNQKRFTINALAPRNGEYAKNKDRDGLDKESRKRIEEIKDRLSYPEDDFTEVWE